jgi:hypothetical protein
MMTKQVNVQSGRVTTEGDNLYYEVRGQGLPLVLIPGAGGDADRYTAVAEILSDEYMDFYGSLNQARGFSKETCWIQGDTRGWKGARSPSFSCRLTTIIRSILKN